MIHDSGVAFDNTINREVGAVTGVGDFLIFKDPEGGLDGFSCSSAGLEKLHRHLGSTITVNSKAYRLKIGRELSYALQAWR